MKRYPFRNIDLTQQNLAIEPSALGGTEREQRWIMAAESCCEETCQIIETWSYHEWFFQSDAQEVLPGQGEALLRDTAAEAETQRVPGLESEAQDSNNNSIEIER